MSQRSKYWVFTGNNYTADNLDYLRRLNVKYIGFAKEVGKNGTPHLQGLICVNNKIRFNAMKMTLPDGFHIEVMKGTTKEARDYFAANIEKPNPDLTEIGELPVKSAGAGKRNDLSEAVKLLVKGATDTEVFDMYGDSYVRNKRTIHQVADSLRIDSELKRRRIEFQTATLRPWQQRVFRNLQLQSRRKILFVVDKTGDQGKTFLADYLEALYNCEVYTSSAAKDVSFAIKSPDIVIFDFSKSQVETTNWATIEHVKDGRIFCTKYESIRKFFTPPSVAVFMNDDPPMDKFSADRYDIMDINEVIAPVAKIFKPTTFVVPPVLDLGLSSMDL